MTLSPQSLTEVRFSGHLDKHAKPVPDRACQTEKYTPLDYEILTDAERQFVATAFAHSGLAVADYRARPLRRRIAAALRAARVAFSGRPRGWAAPLCSPLHRSRRLVRRRLAPP
jgi:hypothetical protein